MEISTLPQIVVNKHPNETIEQKPLRKQLQFYFSNSNYPRDEFLLGIAEKNDGWVPFTTFLEFKKITNLTKDISALVTAAKESSYLNVNEDETMVKRIAPLPEVDDFDERCVHVSQLRYKPFPRLPFIKKILCDDGRVMSVWNVRSRTPGKKELLVEFENVEQAKKIAERGTAQYVDKFTGYTIHLKVMSKADYLLLPEPEPAKRKSEAIEPPELVLGTCVKIPGLKDHMSEEKNFREFCDSIKEDCSEIGAVKFVDVNPEGYGILRFDLPGPGAELVEKLKSGNLLIGNKFETAELLTEEEEKAYKLKVLSAPKKKKFKRRRQSNRQ